MQGKNEKKITISELIVSKLNEMNFDVGKVNNKVLMYFLNKNITTIFGRNEFDLEKDCIDFFTKVENVEGKQCISLYIDYAGIKYQVSINSEGNLVLKNEKDGILFVIRAQNAVMQNMLVNVKEDETVSEFQNVNLGEEIYFDYQKTVAKGNDEVTEYPAYRVRPVGVRHGNKEVYEIESTKKNSDDQSAFKKMVNRFKEDKLFAINANKGSLDDLDYIREIYNEIENRCEQENQELKH